LLRLDNMIEKEDVRNIAKLARLGISTAEEVRFQEDLSSVLDYIDLLNEVDVADVKPTFHPSESYFKKNVVREDIGEDGEEADKLIKASPDKEERYFKVKSIF